MKLKYTLEAVEMGEESVAVPVGDGAKQMHGVLRLNREGVEILSLLKEETTEEAIVRALAARYDNSPEELAAMVRRAVDALRVSGLLDE